MIRLLLVRLIQSSGVMLAVSLVAFVLLAFVGDPVSGMVGQDATRAERAAIRADLGLDDPIHLQYGRFLVAAVQGDFGVSYRLKQPVAPLILMRLPATLELVALSALIALLAGISIGSFAALHPDNRIGKVLLGLSLVGVSLPTFVIGIGLIYIFAIQLDWLPSSGRGGVTQTGSWETSFLTIDGWRSIILPALTLSLFQISVIARLVHSEIADVMRSTHIRFAVARGLSARTVHYRHALRNALLPIINITGLNIGGLIAYSIVTESIFQWPGTGLLFLQSVAFADIPVLSAYLCLVAAIFLAINLLVDLLCLAVDPRLRTTGTG